MDTGFIKKTTVRFFLIVGIIILSAKLLGGLSHFMHDETTEVKSKYDNGTDKEVWVYKKLFFGKKKKIKEITYFSNGNKESEVDYKHGKITGWARMWYKTGKLHVEATYKNNKPHGVRIAYHKNGRVFCRAEYHKGKLIRKKNWDEEGNEIYLPIDRE